MAVVSSVFSALSLSGPPTPPMALSSAQRRWGAFQMSARALDKV